VKRQESTKACPSVNSGTPGGGMNTFTLGRVGRLGTLDPVRQRTGKPTPGSPGVI
jgi:hypothetical protein